MNLTLRLNLSTSHDGFAAHLFSKALGLVDNEQSTSADCLLSASLSTKVLFEKQDKIISVISETKYGTVAPIRGKRSTCSSVLTDEWQVSLRFHADSLKQI